MFSCSRSAANLVRMRFVMQFRLIQTLKRLIACLLICLCQPVGAQTVELSLEQGRIAARQAVLQGRPELAGDLALALREANPDDRVAFIVLAAVQPQLGAAREGRLAGVRAFRLSSTEGERYEAAPRSMRLMNGAWPRRATIFVASAI